MEIESDTLAQKVPVGGIFRHYKGKEYKVLAVGRHSEDHTFYVVYQGLYYSSEFGNYPIWVRPLDLFLESITLNGRQIPRFELTHPLRSGDE